MRSLLWCFFVIAFSAACQAQPGSIPQKLDSVLTALYQTHRFNGTVLYADHGQVVYKKAFGVSDVRSGNPLNTRSAFNLASISKQFVAVCIMMLAEKGQLSFDDNIRKYFPELPYSAVTVHNLLTHTSGIPEYFDLFQRYSSPLDTLSNEKMVDLLATYKPALDFETGTCWAYCNTNYVLLATLIERITKQPLIRFFDARIAKPLGLHDTYVFHLQLPSLPANHVIGFAELNGLQKMDDLIRVDGVTGDGNIYSSVEDLFKWDQALYTEKLVSRKTMNLAFHPVTLKNGTDYPYGFGWFIKKETGQFSHTGSWAGFKNLIHRDTLNHRVLIVLSSGQNGLARGIADSIFMGRPYQIPSTWLIANVRVVDGTGTPARAASVRIEGNKILAVGKLMAFPGETVIDGRGKTLAPGFIDSHSHAGGSMDKYPEALAALNQGITTIVSGQDGDGDPVDSIRLAGITIPRAVNIATYTGHTTLREMAMGAGQLNRRATTVEIKKMEGLLKTEMEHGSLGLSTGLEYEGAFYSDRAEVISLAKVAAAQGGRYISHVRNEDSKLSDAIDEIIQIGKIAKLPVQISHIKIALKDDWLTAPALLARLDAARLDGVDITADCYPYNYWHSTLRVLFPKKDFSSMESANFACAHLFDPEGSVLVRFAPDTSYAGKTIQAIAEKRHETAATTLIYLISAADAYGKTHPSAGGVEAVMSKSMSEADVASFLSWPNTNICSDGANGGHPRGYGTFTRVLGKYVREQKIMTLENAIQKMTSLAAEHTGIKNRGLIVTGYYADLVLLDPETVNDEANIQHPKALSTGILQVWVNGISVYRDQQSEHQFPGKFLARE